MPVKSGERPGVTGFAERSDTTPRVAEDGILELHLVSVKNGESLGITGFSGLSQRRKAKLAGLKNPLDRLHCAGAGLLLARVLGPVEEAFSYSPEGKPSLPGVEFNLSHGGDYVALGRFSHPLGIDLEPLCHQVTTLSQRFLHPLERIWLQEHPSKEDFTRFWTRLESVLKADGRGFALLNREYPVVGPDCPWFVHTLDFDGHILSCAAAVPFQARVVEHTLEELLTN